MSRTFIRQSTQIRQSSTYNDALAAGATMESSAANLEDDLNALRSQMKRMSGEAKWYDALSGRDLKNIGLDLNDIENKKFLFRSQVLTDVAVPAAQNFVVLSVASGETPTETAAVGGTSTANGAVVASLTGATGSNSLAKVNGANAIQPKNLCIIRDATTGDPILSSGKQVYGLLQAASTVADGDAFNDTTKKVQISFVVENSGGNDLVACPAGDIATKSINYSYALRVNLDAIPEQAFLNGVFVDQAAAVDVTLNNAIDNQSGPATQQQDVQWRIDDSKTLKYQTSDGGRDLFNIAPSAAGDTVAVNADTFDVNATTADFSGGVKANTGGTELDFGVAAGTIGSVGKLDLTSASTFDLSLLSGHNLVFSDSYKAGSTYASAMKLASASSEWSNFKTKFGEVSILNAIAQAANSTRVKGFGAVIPNHINADTNVTGAGGSPNLDNVLPNYQGKDFIANVNVYVNGTLLTNGADSLTLNDCYPGADASTGDLRFKLRLDKDDVVTMEIF